MTDRQKKALLACGPGGALIFTGSFTIQGFYRADYDPLRFPVSSLSIGPSGWIQVLTFIVTGFLFMFFSSGVMAYGANRRPWSRIALCILLTGAGMIGAGVFSTDPVFGYPPELPLRLAQFTSSGHLHDLFSVMVSCTVPLACFIIRPAVSYRGDDRLSSYSLFTAIFVLLTFILAGIGFKQAPVLTDVAGLLQRLSIVSGCAWLTVLGIYFIDRMSSAAPGKNDPL